MDICDRNRESFRFAIMGAGKIARKFCDAVAQIADCRVAAVASKSLDRARAFAGENQIPAFYDSYEEMLRRERPDCVYIATTCDSHYPLGMLCLDYHTPVLCEKAMFTGGAEAERFFDRAQSQRTFAMEALWSRFLPAIRQTRDWVSGGRIGAPVFCEMGIGFRAPDDAQNRYFNPALGGGAACDITVYGYQILTWVLDKGVERASVEAVPAGTGVDATELVLMRLQGDIPAVIKSSFMTDVEERLVVYGTRGRIVVPHPHYAGEAFLYGPDGSEAEHFVDRGPENGFVYEIMEAMRCVRENRVQSDVVPHASTLACARLFDQIRSSTR